MTNRLSEETSPYLQQHAENPVDWYPWGKEAFARAVAEDKPVFLSIGYSACHWCHVMAHESFENADTAALMNEHFINIKVDREERPDVDNIYMQAVTALTGQGGWPMSVFLTPEGQPFYGGTYYPPQDRYGIPSFQRVILSVADAYKNRRTEMIEGAAELTAHINQRSTAKMGGALTPGILDAAARGLSQQFDRVYGGFGGAPKFPPSMSLEFLLRTHLRTNDRSQLDMITKTLDMMSSGGMYDHLGGGFHRYSTDERWLVPHFEKMLYDNALLALVYLHAFQVTRDLNYRRVVTETLDYVAREMTAPEGGFYSAQDADSEGVEGKFFVWTVAELTEILGAEEALLFAAYYDVTATGNWEGHNILHTPRPIATVLREFNLSLEEGRQRLSESRRKLFAHREERIKPGRDEKILTSWNGLMLRAFAEAARVLKRDDYREVALRNATFMQERHYAGGQLWRTSRGGEAKLGGFLEDYAFLADGLLALYESTFATKWFVLARELTDTAINLCRDEIAGFFDTPANGEELISRPKDLYDNAIPAANSVMAEVLLRLGLYTGESRYMTLLEGTLGQVAGALPRYPNGFGRLLCALDFYLSKPCEIALIGDPGAEDTTILLNALNEPYLPNRVLALALPADGEAALSIPILAERGQKEPGKATVYVCRNGTCFNPVTTAAELITQIVGVF